MRKYRIGYCSNKHLPPISRPRVFISYSNRNRSQVALLRNQRRNGYLHYVDYSIKERYDARWTESARYRIRESDCVLVALNGRRIGKGMVKEVQMARRMNKPIIAVKNSPDIPTPSFIKNNASKVISYDCEKIQREIDRSHSTNGKKQVKKP